MSNFSFNKNSKWPGLAKVVEETSELNIELSKLVMLDGETNHWTGEIRPLVKEELADSLASIEWFINNNFSEDEIREINSRKWTKMEKYTHWSIENPLNT